ncbi:bifunctional 2-polyprenyl-6-hydroxyphenol methylase/3-demethylubiquinol 3-O-methyltransferase UbiG [Vitiosangium sp. GDMCC 1.1324]|uniref:class I SAM-dependent methyltransferase n=1 Tax=Vitiosangium sp. (strain GDMCC 1.1324) TaxID=2138576 RepID=UPI00130D85E5|nr:class I SAM-dependent methyltransferase [Vitiosangium sp. GDMCC 1.1324]
MSSETSVGRSGQADVAPEELPAEEREVVAYYDALAPTYDADRFSGSYGAYLDGLERRALRRWLQGPRVLDLACGTGRFLDLASEGLDLSGKMVERARTKWPDKRIHHAPAWSIPADDGSYDTVFALHFFMHLHLGAIRRVLDECRRVLRRGGVMVFDFPNALRRRLVGYKASGWHAGTELMASDLRMLGGGHWRLVASRGVALAPIHRLPHAARPAFMAAEVLLGRTLLKHLASYQLVKLEKVD